MQILVIGGTSFMGPYAVRRLHEQGHRVAVYHRGKTPGDLPPEVEHIHDPTLRMDDRPGLAEQRERIKRLSPDVVLDMMALTEQAMQTTMDALRGVAGRIVVASSADVYRAYGRLRGVEPGPPDPVPLGEDAPLRERLYPYRGETPHAADDPRRWADLYDKILVERVALGDAELPGTVLRLPMVYGPYDRQGRVVPYLKRMDDGRPAILVEERLAEWRWTRGYVEDVGAAIALAVVDARATGRIYNVGEATADSEAEWIGRIAEAAGWQGRIVRAPQERLPAHLHIELDTAQQLVTDTTRIRQELGFAELVPPAEAMRRTVAWARANPPTALDDADFDYAAEDAALAELEG